MISDEPESAAGDVGSTQIPMRAIEIEKPRREAPAGLCVNPCVALFRYRIVQLPDQVSNLEQTG